jgi:hypothetical protein
MGFRSPQRQQEGVVRPVERRKRTTVMAPRMTPQTRPNARSGTRASSSAPPFHLLSGTPGPLHQGPIMTAIVTSITVTRAGSDFYGQGARSEPERGCPRDAIAKLPRPAETSRSVLWWSRRLGLGRRSGEISLPMTQGPKTVVLGSTMSGLYDREPPTSNFFGFPARVQLDLILAQRPLSLELVPELRTLRRTPKRRRAQNGRVVIGHHSSTKDRRNYTPRWNAKDAFPAKG